jgi:hypothetical protein
MHTKKVNLFSVIVAALPYILLGYPWFSIFRDPWFEGGGLTVKQLINGPSYLFAFIVAIISGLLMAYSLAIILIRTGKQTIIGGLKSALFIWVGFILPLLASQYTFEARSLEYFAITSGYPLLGLIIMGTIIGAWKNK